MSFFKLNRGELSEFTTDREKELQDNVESGGKSMGYSKSERGQVVYSSREAIDALVSNCGTKVIFNSQGIVSAEEMVNRLKAEGEI